MRKGVYFIFCMFILLALALSGCAGNRKDFITYSEAIVFLISSFQQPDMLRKYL